MEDERFLEMVEQPSTSTRTLSAETGPSNALSIDTSINPILRTDAIEMFLMNFAMIRLSELRTFANNCWKIYILTLNCE